MAIAPPADTFTWPAKRGPLSPGIQNPQSWQDEGILIPHEMFRWYFAEIRAMLKAMDGSQVWKMKLFSKWIETYVLGGIHHHHESEENIYNPMITEKGGTLTPSVTADHTALMDGIAKARVILGKMDAGDTAALAEFKEAFEKWMQTCEKHFDDEEVQYPQQLKSTGITEAEEGAVVEKIIQSLGLDGNKLMLPPILYAMCLWGGEEKMQAFFGKLPPPIQFLCSKCWVSDFWVNNLRVMQAIKSDEVEYVPESPQCAICTIS